MRVALSNNKYIIIRVRSAFSLVENCDLLEHRRTLTPFQRQAITAILELLTANSVLCLV